MFKKPDDPELKKNLEAQAKVQEGLKKLKKETLKGISSEDTKALEELNKKVEELLHRPMSSYQDWIGAMNEICDLAVKIRDVICHRVAPCTKISQLDRLGLYVGGKLVTGGFKLIGKFFGSEEPIKFSTSIGPDGKLQFAANYKGDPLNEEQRQFLNTGMTKFAESCGKGYAFNPATQSFVNTDGSPLAPEDHRELERELTKLANILTKHYDVKFEEQVPAPAPAFGG